jgi:L-fucose mutarotase/ribose pyranase (RbsD/FucU family)
MAQKRSKIIGEEVKGSGEYGKAGFQYERINVSAKAQMAVVLTLLGLVVAVPVTIIIAKKIKARKAEGDLNKVLTDSTKTDNSKLTITEIQAQDFANKLHTAMASNGTDESQIKAILIDKNLSNDDIKLIVRKFGLKDYGFFGDPTWVSRSFAEKLDLMGWLRKEVGGGLLSQLQSKFASAGLTI